MLAALLGEEKRQSNDEIVCVILWCLIFSSGQAQTYSVYVIFNHSDERDCSFLHYIFMSVCISRDRKTACVYANFM